MTEKMIIDAYVRMRTIDQTIPDDVLDFMKDAAIEMLRISEEGESEWIFTAYKSEKDFQVHDHYFIKGFSDFNKMKEFSSNHSFEEKLKYGDYVSHYIKSM